MSLQDDGVSMRAERLSPHPFLFSVCRVSDGSSHIQQALSETKRAGIVTINIFASSIIDQFRA